MRKVSFIENTTVCNKTYLVIKDVLNDGTTEFNFIPWSPESYKAIMWIKSNLIDYTLSTRESVQEKTQLVRLRIANNMIFKLPLSKDLQIQISELIKKMYWELRKEIYDWYIANVLPF